MKYLVFLVLLAGCAGMDTFHPTDHAGKPLGTIVHTYQTFDDGTVAYGKTVYDAKGAYKASEMVGGPGLLPAALKAGAIVGAASVLRPDDETMVNRQQQGQVQQQSTNVSQKVVDNDYSHPGKGHSKGRP